MVFTFPPKLTRRIEDTLTHMALAGGVGIDSNKSPAKDQCAEALVFRRLRSRRASSSRNDTPRHREAAGRGDPVKSSPAIRKCSINQCTGLPRCARNDHSRHREATGRGDPVKSSPAIQECSINQSLDCRASLAMTPSPVIARPAGRGDPVKSNPATQKCSINQINALDCRASLAMTTPRHREARRAAAIQFNQPQQNPNPGLPRFARNDHPRHREAAGRGDPVKSSPAIPLVTRA